MKNSRRAAWARASAVALLSGSLAGCQQTEVAIPLLVVAGPNDFESVEVRSAGGESVWRLEADPAGRLRHLIFAVVPDGFRQVLPESGPPRPLRLGEGLVIESRTRSRVFLHRAYATSESTISILQSEMRKIEPELAAGARDSTGRPAAGLPPG